MSARWDLAAAALHGAWALAESPGVHGALSAPVYHSVELATDNYRWSQFLNVFTKVPGVQEVLDN